MKQSECGRDSEVLSAVRAGWCDEQLRLHMATCGSCLQLYEVAGLVFEEGRASVRYADVPASGAVWWRMQLRKRREVSRKAERTLTLVQAISLGFALVIAVVAFGSQLLSEMSQLEALATFTPARIAIVIGVTSILLVASFGAWFVLGVERPRRPDGRTT